MSDDVFAQCLAGGFIDFHNPAFREVEQVVDENQRRVFELNAGHHDADAVRRLVGEIIGAPVDPSTVIQTPFSTDFGRHIRLGRDVFINKECFFVDLGGITIGDRALIAPRVTILTVNHALEPDKRRSMYTAGVTIGANAWIGAGATICPGVTIGENSVVGAGSVVTKDVPANVVVGGVPAKVLKQI